MNYYNPYYIPITAVSRPQGLLKSLFSGEKISNFINGTSRTLNLVNQAIPLVKQVKPVIKNASTMFKVMNEFKKVDEPKKLSTEVEIVKENLDEGPKFFI